MASKYRYDNDEEETQRPTLLGLLKRIILKPFRIVLSKPALRAYLTTALIFITVLFLLAAASTAYTLFYWSYVPRIGFSRDIHLQWDDVYPIGQEHGLDRAYNHFPHGTVSLEGDLVSAQAYDVKLEIELPRTRKNREVGNFMLDVSLLGSTGILDTLKDGLTTSQTSSESAPVLARSRRPASLHYRSLPVEMLHRITQLPWYILGVRDESETLTIAVFERTSFPRGSTSVPTALKLEVQSSKRMQIYSAKAVFHARFRGLRWLMYNHRVVSAVVFVGVFWGVEMVFAGIAWAMLIAYLGPAFKAEEQKPGRVKEEATSEDEERGFLSDTERTFPTLSGQQPLRFHSPEIKEEKKEEELGDGVRLQDVPPLTNLEADDEDEDGDYFLDSGIGTSMESGSGSRPGSMRKRRGRGSFRE